MCGSATRPSARMPWRLLPGVLSLLLAVAISAPAAEPPGGELTLEPPVPGQADEEHQRSVYDLSLHDPRDIRLLLERLEQLARHPNSQAQSASIALILHGPELQYFSIRNYASHRELVDLAAKLDAFQIIEVKACRSKMQELNLQPEDMPAFIEIVPYGPGEVERLVRDGYLEM